MSLTQENSLKDIYSGLCECCGEQTDWWKRTAEVNEQKKEPPSNHFTHLSIEDCSCGDDEHEAAPVESCESGQASNCSLPSSSIDTELRLSGDHLSDAIETIGLVQVSAGHIVKGLPLTNRSKCMSYTKHHKTHGSRPELAVFL